MDEQLRRYESYARMVKRLMLLAGLWPGRATFAFLRLVVVFQSIVSIVTTYGIMHLVVSNVGNFALLTRSFGIAIGFCTILLKVVIFSFYRDRLVELHETLDENFCADLADINYRPALLSMIEYFDRPTLCLTLSTLGIVCMYNLSPFISIIIQLSHGAEVLRYRTPFPSEYDLPESNVLFVICYVVEVGASYAVGMITASTDALFGFYVFQIVSQLRVLSYRMYNLTSSDDHSSIIKECVARRQVLVECRDQLQTIYGPVILWMLTSSALIICANVFQASQITLANAPLVGIYIFMKIMQTLLYGTYGLLLTSESEVLHDAIYCSGWPGCGDQLFSSNVLTMLMCKPLTLKACQFYPISLDIVIGIVNTALSYYFLLRTLDEK